MQRFIQQQFEEHAKFNLVWSLLPASGRERQTEGSDDGDGERERQVKVERRLRVIEREK